MDINSNNHDYQSQGYGIFSGNSQKAKKVNLLVATPDGITPLHDAVVNQQLEAVRLLLNYGGKAFLISTHFSVICSKEGI